MILTLSTYGIWAFVAWLTLIGVMMALAPRGALALLRRAGSTHAINMFELGARLVFGLSMMGVSAASAFPDVIFYIGAFLAATSVLILVLPLRWHNGYAVWWADRLPPIAVRLFAPLTFAAAAALVWFVLPSGTIEPGLNPFALSEHL